MEEGVPIESGMITQRIESAQKAVETQNFESRKHVLEYDDVMNKQREAVYGLRKQLMEGVDQKQLITEDYASTILSNVLDEFAPKKRCPTSGKPRHSSTPCWTVFGVRFAKAERDRHRNPEPPRAWGDHFRALEGALRDQGADPLAPRRCATTSAS